MDNWTKPNEDDETPPHILAWQDETAHLGKGAWFQQEIPMQVDTCVFLDGKHYAGELCPHNNDEYPIGWTV